jgi:branched-chain amino acid aminotransferase
MEEVIYLNGSLVPRSEAKVSVFDHGFLYGYGLFETMRAYNGRIFLLERHIERLITSAAGIGLNVGLSGTDLGKACTETVIANNLNEARIRLTVTHGEAESFPWADTAGKNTVVITARPYTPFSEEKYRQGFRVGVASLRRNSQSLISGVKSTNYLDNVLAKMEINKDGLDEALMLNEKGYIAECGSSNIFFIGDSGLVTPSKTSGMLPGITRALVIELAGILDIKVAETHVGLSDLNTFQEAFVTNSTMEIMPLVSVRDETGYTVTIGNGKPGRITRRLTIAYKERVERETTL